MATKTYQIKKGDTLGAIAKAQKTSVSDLLKKNPQIKDPNKIYAGKSLNLGGGSSSTSSKSNTTTKGTTTDKPKDSTTASGSSTGGSTIKDVAKNITVPDYTQDEVSKTIGNRYKTEAVAEIDEEEIRRKAREGVQAQIDALDRQYIESTRRAKQVAKGELGTASAIQARSGLLGSDFAAGQNRKVEGELSDVLDELGAKRQAEIQKLYTDAENAALGLLTEKRTARDTSTTKYLEFLSKEGEKKKSAAKAFAKALLDKGIDVTELDPDQINKLTTSYGLSDAEFKELYRSTKDENEKAKLDMDVLRADAKEKLNKANTFELSEGQARYELNEETGKFELVAKNAKTFAPKGGSSGGASGAATTDLGQLAAQVASTLPGTRQGPFWAAFNGARNDQDKISVIAVNGNIPADARNDLINTAAGQRSLDKAIAMIENGLETGVLQAGANYGLGLLGGQLSPELTQAKQYITAAIQPYRSSITGAAWGTQEEAEYKGLFGNVSDQPETLLTKLKTLKEIMNDKRVAVLAAGTDPLGMNKAFEQYYSDFNPATDVDPQDIYNDNVQVLNRETGRLIEIPQSSLQEALDSGVYEEI